MLLKWCQAALIVCTKDTPGHAQEWLVAETPFQQPGTSEKQRSKFLFKLVRKLGRLNS